MWHTHIHITRRHREAHRDCALSGGIASSADVTDEAFVKRLFEQTIDRFGKLDLLFNVRRRFSQKANILFLSFLD